MFFSLPIEFGLRGRVNREMIERVYPEEISGKTQGHFRIVLHMASNSPYTAEFNDQESRDKVFTQLERFLTGRDKVPQFDSDDSLV